MAEAGDEVKTSGFNKKKLKEGIRKWKAAEAENDEAVKAANTAFSEAKDDILDGLEHQGVKRSVFKTVMQRIKLLDKADKLKERFGDKTELGDQYDAILIEAGLISPDDDGTTTAEKVAEAIKDDDDATTTVEQSSEGAAVH